MKAFALLGLATLVCAENEDNTARRRRLAIQKCSFTPLRAGAHDPNCLGEFSWEMVVLEGDSKVPAALQHHDYRCCLDKRAGWTDIKAQQACANAASCTDIKTDDAACKAKAKATSSFYSIGYSTTTCSNQYADDCRSSVTCDTASGFSGTADLACQTGLNGNFILRGCARGDAGTLGSDQTSKVYIVVPNAAPQESGTAKSSYADCQSFAVSTAAFAWVAGNGGCDMENVCNTADTCAVMPNGWNDKLEPSESEDTYLRPYLFKSQLNERCVDVAKGARPTGLETRKDCTANPKSNDDTASYGGFALYGDRFSCWRNVGGGVRSNKNNQMNAFDLTYKVIKANSNAGIGVTIFEYEDNVNNFNGIWNGDDQGKGYGLCTGVRPSLGGCTAELAAMMCEAYNRELVKGGQTDTTGFCVGFTLQESSTVIGSTAKKRNTKYIKVHDHDMLVGFFSTAAGDADWDVGNQFNGGYFKSIEVAGCLKTSTSNCLKCEECLPTHSLTSDGKCLLACKAFQYSSNGVCTYRAAHCIDGNALGTTCTKCHAGFEVDLAGTGCEETGCKVPKPMKSGLETVDGAEQGTSPACKADQNLVPGSACGVSCQSGKFSNKASLKHTYSCVTPGPPVVPTLTCASCTVTSCSTCPSNPLCDTCNRGHKLATDQKSCGDVACPDAKEYVCIAGKIATLSAIAINGEKSEAGCAATCDANPLCAAFDYSATALTDTCRLVKAGNTPRPPGDGRQYCTVVLGTCNVCPEGTAGTLDWDSLTSTWDTTPCEACALANCKNCRGNKDECITCNAGWTVKTVAKKECVEIPYCPYGTKGTVTYSIGTGLFSFVGCTADPATCEDSLQTKGACTDCANGFAGSVDWDFANTKWNTDQCHAVACPLSTETTPACNNCPAFQTGKPVWDDLFNQWVGCIANDFGFSGPSASWAGSVSAQQHVIETKSAEMLHIANSQYDAIKDKWICDAGYAGAGCKQRLCPETVAFTSGTDGFTPSLSAGTSYWTDAARGTSATFSNQHSYRECAGRGTCDFETGLCQCFPGFTGVGCRRTTCPNGCSGHGVCMNDDTSNYHAAGNFNLPSEDSDINTWGNLWASDKFQGCSCDGGWGGNDCSLRQCPRGDDPETQCADNLGNDVQIIECTNIFAQQEHFFKLRFTDQMGNRYNTRAVVISEHTPVVTQDNALTGVSLAYSKAAAHSIQTALESLPNFVIPKLEVTTADIPLYQAATEQVCVPPTGKRKVCNDVEVYKFDKKYTMQFELKFTDARNSGQQSLLDLVADVSCASGVQPKFKNADTFDPTCTVTRKANNVANLRENAECSNRGLCNRKTAECNCFDGYTGLACDVVAQTY